MSNFEPDPMEIIAETVTKLIWEDMTRDISSNTTDKEINTLSENYSRNLQNELTDTLEGEATYTNIIRGLLLQYREHIKFSLN